MRRVTHLRTYSAGVEKKKEIFFTDCNKLDFPFRRITARPSTPYISRSDENIPPVFWRGQVDPSYPSLIYGPFIYVRNIDSSLGSRRFDIRRLEYGFE